MFGHESSYNPEKSLTNLRSVQLFIRALWECGDPELIREGMKIAERAKDRIQLREALMVDKYHYSAGIFEG